MLMLAGPSLHHEWISGELARVALLVDGSSSMGMDDQIRPRGSTPKAFVANEAKTTTANAEGNPSTRLNRARRWLQGDRNVADSGWLAQQRGNFHLQLYEFAEADAEGSSLPVAWDSRSHAATAPIEFDLASVGNRTAIGDAFTPRNTTTAPPGHRCSKTGRNRLDTPRSDRTFVGWSVECWGISGSGCGANRT